MTDKRASVILLALLLIVVGWVWGWLVFWFPRYVAVLQDLDGPLPGMTRAAIALAGSLWPYIAGWPYVYVVLPAIVIVLILKEFLPNKKVTATINAACLVAVVAVLSVCSAGVYLGLRAMP